MSKLLVTIDGHTFDVALDLLVQNGAEMRAAVNNEQVAVVVPNADEPIEEMEWIVVDGRPYEVVFDPDMRWLKAYSGIRQLEIRDLEALAPRPRSGDGRIKAPIPGLITRVLAKPGDQVEIGQPLLVLEAMKMENEIRAPLSGLLEALHVVPGQSVVRHDVLAEIV